MKVAFIFLAVCFVAVAKQIKSLNEVNDAFEKFKKDQRVKYKDKKEESEREAQYMKCRAFVKKHNEKFANGLYSFSLKENFLCDKFEHEKERISKGNKV